MKQPALNTSAPADLDPASHIRRFKPPARPRAIRKGVRLNIRGRSVRLRGLHRPATGLLGWLLILGPGLIASSAGNDAGGIATYSSVGAKYGYNLIWVMIIITISLAVVQEMCARLGAATGKGLLDLIRERFGLGWGMFAVSVILLANGGLVMTEFVGIGAAAELFGVSRLIAVPIAAALIWYLVIFGNYGRIEKIFLFMTLVFFAYPIAAVLSRPDWRAVARGAFIPEFRSDPDYLLLLVSLIGTTITPYMRLFQQSSTVERGAARRHYGPERVDAYAGAIFSNLMAITMIIAAAATLHVAGRTRIETAADAARALEPLAGKASEELFGVGLLGASLLAAAVLPLATSYAISEMFGIAKGVNLNYRRARSFFNLFTGLVVAGALAALIPNIPVIKLLLLVQALNGALLPIILLFIMRLINDERLTGALKNTRIYNLLGWGTFALVTSAVTIMLVAKFIRLLL
jgi:NRAMP (natural resistance-associated macrophage protein)-like metal ion transporter